MTSPVIRRYPFPKRLKTRAQKVWLTKAIFWHSAVTENTAWFAGVFTKYRGEPTPDTDAHTVRRTGRMLRIVELCLTGLACGRIGAVLPIDQRQKNCRPPLRAGRRNVH